MFGAAAMSLSSFCVVSNALRLNFFKLRDPSKDRALKKKEKTARSEAEQTETMIVLVGGMMCEHCEMTVKKALEALKGITEATADFHSGRVIVKYDGDISEEEIRIAIENEDYEFIGIE